MKGFIKQWFKLLGNTDEERLKVVSNLVKHSKVDGMRKIDFNICVGVLKEFERPIPNIVRAERKGEA